MEIFMDITKGLAIAAVLSLAFPQAAVAGDAAAGERKFALCKACHEISTPKNRLGPSLQGVMGRKAGTLEGFKFSDAMKNSGVTWDAATLAAYLANPKTFMPGNKMAFAGFKKPEDIENMVEYLAKASP
jgi:cytochrome c2